MADAVMTVENLSLHYFTRQGAVRAVDEVSLRLTRGETLGLVGESGCGKTSLATALLAMPSPPGRITSGRILLEGTDILALPERELRARIRWEKISLVFQGAMNSLTPVHTVGRQMRETLLRHRPLPRSEADARIQKYIRLVGLPPEVVRRYPHELSGGMKQRVVIAAALFLEPRVVVMDEPTTALDVIVQAQILNTVKELKAALDLSLIFITHDLAMEAEVADRMAVMYAGRIVETATNEHVFGGSPCHPYTTMLLAATPRLHRAAGEPAFIPGSPPDLLDPPPGCRFRARCPLAFARCTEEPPLREVSPGHQVACWRFE